MNTYQKMNIDIISIITTTGTQSGANTHHQDHVITLHSLSTINAIVKSVGNPPIEIDILLFSLIIYYI